MLSSEEKAMMTTKTKGMMHISANSASTTWKTAWVPGPKRFREKEPALIFFGAVRRMAVIFFTPSSEQ